MAVERRIDEADLPQPIQEMVEQASELDQPIVIERAGEVVGVVISPRDFALLTARKHALNEFGAVVDELREKFGDLPEDQAIAEAERAVLETRAEMQTERDAHQAND